MAQRTHDQKSNIVTTTSPSHQCKDKYESETFISKFACMWDPIFPASVSCVRKFLYRLLDFYYYCIPQVIAVKDRFASFVILIRLSSHLVLHSCKCVAFIIYWFYLCVYFIECCMRELV